jgi:Raf kinase inhibitor-like YbhB/YbcL family protein
MKWRWVLVIALVILAVGAGILIMTQRTALAPATPTKSVGSNGMEIRSTAFNNNEAIPGRYSCQGEKINPPLTFSGVPQGTASLALVVDDPDAPNGTFDHWVMWNLPSSLSEIPENWELEPGVSVGANGVGDSKWTAPCPPSGTHHYHFKLYALDRKLDLAEGSSKGDLEKAMEGHIVAQTELVGTYAKQ